MDWILLIGPVAIVGSVTVSLIIDSVRSHRARERGELPSIVVRDRML